MDNDFTEMEAIPLETDIMPVDVVGEVVGDLVEVMEPTIADILEILESLPGMEVECESCEEIAEMLGDVQETLAETNMVLHQLNGLALFMALTMLYCMIKGGVRGVFRND